MGWARERIIKWPSKTYLENDYKEVSDIDDCTD